MAIPLRIKTSILFQLNTCGHSPYVTYSLTRGWVCELQLFLPLAFAVILRSESGGTQIRNLPNLEDQDLIFVSPRNSVAQLYPQALGTLLVASYVLQCYGEGIQTLLHTG
jgi:hypothetical protein